MSAETQAIIDRLKAEGDLIRNTGTNSIKATNIQLAKFESLFSAISSNIAEQTDMMRTQLGIVADSQAAARTEAQFDEIKTQAEKPSGKESGEKPLSEVGEKTGNKIASALTMKNLAIGAAGLFVGYNLIKGAIDEATGGSFTNMEKAMGEVIWEDLPAAFNNTMDYLKEIDWSGVQSAINVMSGAINAINWTNFTSAINTMSNTVSTFTTWLGDTGVGDIVGAVVAGGLVSAGAKGAVMGLLGNAAAGGSPGLLNKFKAIGPGIALAAAGLAVYYGDDVATWMADQMGVENAADNETVRNLGTVFQIGGAAMSIAMMFGPVGMIAVAAATAAAGLGVLIHGWVKNTKAESARQFAEDVEVARQAVEESADPTAMSDENLLSVAKALAEARRRQQLALTNAAISDAETVQEEMEAVIAEQTIDSANGGANTLSLDRLYQDLLSGKEGAAQELQDYAVGLAAQRGGVRRFFKSDEDFVEDLLRDFGRGRTEMGGGINPNTDPDGYRDAVDQWLRDQEAWESIGEGLANGYVNSLKDSNDDKSAIVNKISAPNENGRLILYDEFGNPHLLTNAEQNGSLGALLSSGAMAGTVNISTTNNQASAPVSVTNQGSNVSSVAYMGMGTAGAGGVTVYGLTPGVLGGD